MKQEIYSKFTCLVACLIMAIGILVGVPSAQADLLVNDFTSVLRYDQTTGAFLGVLVHSGSGGLDNAQGSAFGPDGNLYVASFGSRNILRYNGVTGAFIDVFVSSGSGGLGAPNDVTFGPDSNMYVADAFYGTNSILRYNGHTGAFIDVFAAGGGIQQPSRLTFGPDGNLFVGNATSSDVLRYHGDTGLAYPAAGQSGAIFVPGSQGPFNTCIAFGLDGKLYVGSGASPDILRYDGTTGAFLGTFVPNGFVSGVNAGNFRFGPDNNLYVASYFGQSVLRYNGTTGAFIDTFVASGSGGLGRPSGLVFTPKACSLVHDDFNGSALAPIWRLHQGYASVQGGWVTLSGSTPGTRGGYMVTGEGSTWSDYRLSTRALVEGGGSWCDEGPPCAWYVAMVKVRVQTLRGDNRGTYYEVEMWTPPSEVTTGRGAYVALLKVVNDQVSVVREDLAPAGAINDYDNRLDIEAIGTRIRVYVNDQLITDYTDQTANPIMTGGVSLGALWESTTRYDYVYVDAIPCAVTPCPEWNLAADFRVSPNQENPNRDRCGNLDVWYFLESDANTFPDHTPSTYTLLPEFINDLLYVSGLECWQGTIGAPKDRFPSVGINNTGSTQSHIAWTNIVWPPGVIRVHPYPNKFAIVGWRSPITGAVTVTGRVNDLDNSCGDGISWSIDHFKGATNTTLASGSISEGGSQDFHDGIDGAGLASITVNQGDFLYFLVGPNSYYECDTTELTISIRPTVVINRFVTFAPVPSSYRTSRDTTGCPGGFQGTFGFNAILTSKAGSPPLTDLSAQVSVLTGGNLVKNTDGGPGGVGSTLTLSKVGKYSDGVLSPSESVDVPFTICLKQRAPFSFFVDVLGIAR